MELLLLVAAVVLGYVIWTKVKKAEKVVDEVIEQAPPYKVEAPAPVVIEAVAPAEVVAEPVVEAKKPAAKKAPAKKPAAKKVPAKKPAVKKAPAKTTKKI
jgi:trigger factor